MNANAGSIGRRARVLGGILVAVCGCHLRAAVVTHGPLVTAMTDTSATVWVRTDARALTNGVHVSYREVGSTGSWTDTGAVPTPNNVDFTNKVPLSSLTANTKYDYKVYVDGV